MYAEQSYEIIKNRMLSQLSIDIDKREGSFINDMYAPISTEFARFYTELDTLHSIFYVEDCYGEDLDKRVSEFGIPRKLGQRAIGTVTFEGEEMTLIPRNLQLTTDGGLMFMTISQGYINEGTVDILVESVVVGEEGNIEPETPWVVTNGINVAKITNKQAFEGGVNIESDDDLKKRFFDAVRNTRTSGNSNDYIYWAKEVSGVVNAEVTPLHAGNGTVKILVSGENRLPVSEEILNDCDRYIKLTCPIGANPTVVTTTIFDVSVQVSLIIESNVDATVLESNVRKTIESYITTCVDKIYYNKLGAKILSCDGVVDYFNLTINGSTLSTIDIPEDSVALVTEVSIYSEVGVSNE